MQQHERKNHKLKHEYEGSFSNGVYHGQGVLRVHVEEKLENEEAADPVVADTSKQHDEEEVDEKSATAGLGSIETEILAEGEDQESEEATEPGVHIYEGEWVNGRLTGNGKVTSPDGTVHIGFFKEGMRHGPGKSFSPSFFDFARLSGGHYQCVCFGPLLHVKRRLKGICSLLMYHLVGKVISAAGEIFEGEWEEDELVSGSSE